MRAKTSEESREVLWRNCVDACCASYCWQRCRCPRMLRESRRCMRRSERKRRTTPRSCGSFTRSRTCMARVTGTPNLKAADDWAVKTMTSWGLTNAHLEPWTFQPPSAAKPVPGWENMELLAEAVPRTTDGEAAGVDAEHEGNRDGASGDGGAARIGAADGRWI